MLRWGMNSDEVRRAYDIVAGQYHARFADELTHKPFDRMWLDRFAAELPLDARVVEIGCGDGHVAAYLAARGAHMEGLDLSPEMIRVAQRAYPHLRLCVGDVLALPYAPATFDAIVAFYSIVNLTAWDCRVAFAEFARVLRAGGVATLAFHIGDERLRVDDWWETTASLDFHLHPLERVCSQLGDAGFEVILCEHRGPYAPEVEAQTRRGYIVARRRAQ
jgi:ubiquinone/menaquinone biosynthesis C-methylase UbiE